MSRSKAVSRELVGNFARLTSFLTRNRKREPFARCLHQPFCQNFWVTNSAIALGNTLCGYKATPYSALSCFSLFRQLKAFIGVAKAAMEKKKSSVLRRLPESFRPGWRGILAPFFKSSLTACLPFGFLFACCVILFVISALLSLLGLLGRSSLRNQPSVMQSLNLAR